MAHRARGSQRHGEAIPGLAPPRGWGGQGHNRLVLTRAFARRSNARSILYRTAGMTPQNHWLRVRAFCAIAFACWAGITLTAYFLPAQTANGGGELAASFLKDVKPFFAKNCQSCHNSDLSTA